MKEGKNNYSPPDTNIIYEALNGDLNALTHIFSHYESYGNYLVQANIRKFACVSGISVNRYPEEDLKQNMFLRFHKAVEAFV